MNASRASLAEGAFGIVAMLLVAVPARAQTAGQEPVGVGAAAAVSAEPAAASPSPTIPRAQAVSPAAAVGAPAPAASATVPTPTDRVVTAKPAATSGPEPDCKSCRERDAPEGAGAFLLGVGVFDLSALNDRLAANGYERLDTAMTVIGGEGRAVFNSGFVAGGRGAGILAPGGAGPGNLRTSFGGGFGMVDLGFAFVHSQAFLLTLTGDIGGYGWSLGISDQQSARFDDVLKNPRRSSSLGSGGVLVGLTLGIDGRVGIGEAKNGRRGFFTVGARIGALYGPQLGNWGLSDGMDATGGPRTGLAGAYAALAIGFGGGADSRN
jgi:hypothetical protein